MKYRAWDKTNYRFDFSDVLVEDGREWQMKLGMKDINGTDMYEGDLAYGSMIEGTAEVYGFVFYHKKSQQKP